MTNATAIGRRYRKIDQLIAEGNFDVAGSLHHLAVRWNEAQPIDRFRDRNVADLVILVADHRSEVSLVRKLDSFHSESCAENSIERGGRAAALQMAKHTTTRFFAGALGDFTRDDFADSSEPEFAIFRFAHHLLTISWPGAFCDHNERAEIASGVACFDDSRNLVVIKRDLWN